MTTIYFIETTEDIYLFQTVEERDFMLTLLPRTEQVIDVDELLLGTDDYRAKEG